MRCFQAVAIKTKARQIVGAPHVESVMKEKLFRGREDDDAVPVVGVIWLYG